MRMAEIQKLKSTFLKDGNLSQVEKSIILDSRLLQRFLNKNQNSPSKVEAAIWAYLKWRRTQNMDALILEFLSLSLQNSGSSVLETMSYSPLFKDLAPYFHAGFFYFLEASDRHQHPIAVVQLAKFPTTPSEKIHLTKFIHLSLECARYLMLLRHERICVVLNASGAGLRHLDMDLGGHLKEILQKFYPEMIATVHVYNLPWILTGAWSMVSTVLPQESRKRVSFVNGAGLLDHIDEFELPTEFGGLKEESYSGERYAQWLKKTLEKVLVLSDTLDMITLQGTEMEEVPDVVVKKRVTFRDADSENEMFWDALDSPVEGQLELKHGGNLAKRQAKLGYFNWASGWCKLLFLAVLKRRRTVAVILAVFAFLALLRQRRLRIGR